MIYGTSPFGQVTTLVNVTVGSLVEDVASIDWAKSDGLKTIRLLSMTPPTSHAFMEEQYKNVKLTIPAGSLAAYQEDGVWKSFLNMEEKESTGIGNVETADGKDISVEDGTIVVENAEGNISVRQWRAHEDVLASAWHLYRQGWKPGCQGCVVRQLHVLYRHR